jgi:mannose-6-phosphate isomerase-like protein (cupin superfamily)
MKKLMFLAVIMFAVFSASFAADNTMAMKTGKEGIKTVNIGDIKEFDSKAILRKGPLETDKIVFNTYFLEPRQLLRLHMHPASDELFYIVEGQGQFTVGDDQVMVSSGSAIYGPTGVPHGLVNSSKSPIVMISVQAPKPVEINYLENALIICPVCEQENIITPGAKVGDIITCPRCHSRLKLSKTKDGKWMATQI